MLFSKVALTVAVVGMQVYQAVADCGETCYNPAGADGCLSTALGEDICNTFWDGSSGCLYCVRVNCGGYGSSAELAEKAFCAAEGWGSRKRFEEKNAVSTTNWDKKLDFKTLTTA